MASNSLFSTVPPWQQNFWGEYIALLCYCVELLCYSTVLLYCVTLLCYSAVLLYCVTVLLYWINLL